MRHQFKREKFAPIPSGINAEFSLKTHEFMKHKCVFVFLVTIAILFTAPKIEAQQPEGCTLSSWIMQQTPHSTRTNEQPTTDLRDTFITVNEVQQKISIPAGFTMTVFARNIPLCR